MKASSIEEGLRRLEGVIPLARRQQALPEGLRALHREVLRHFVDAGRAPERAEVAALFPNVDVGAALARLDRDDLLVLGADGEVAGAYPFTTEETPHRVSAGGIRVRAMCALDALAVAPMFGLAAVVDSRCAASGDPVRVIQAGRAALAGEPSRDLWVGIAWRVACGHTAHGLCREMVFLRDAGVAERWQGPDAESRSLFSLDDAAEFAARFFLPLVAD